MARNAEQLRAVLEQAVGGHAYRGSRYPAELRAAAATFARSLVAAGGSIGQVAQDLGVPPVTLRRWMLATATAGFRPVEVEISGRPAVGSAVVITPDGYRVEGLDVEGACTLLRSLR